MACSSGNNTRGLISGICLASVGVSTRLSTSLSYRIINFTTNRAKCVFARCDNDVMTFISWRISSRDNGRSFCYFNTPVCLRQICNGTFHRSSISSWTCPHACTRFFPATNELIKKFYPSHNVLWILCSTEITQISI